MEFRKKVKSAMGAMEINQEQLAALIEVSPSTISGYLRVKDRHMPPMDVALRLARVLGMSLDFLADDSLDVDPFGPISVQSAGLVVNDHLKPLRPDDNHNKSTG